MPEPLYIRIRKLKKGEHVARTIDYNDLGQVYFDLDANNKIVGVEILNYVEFTLDGIKLIGERNKK